MNCDILSTPLQYSANLHPITICQMDVIALMKAMPDASVDLMLTDPAYASLEKHRAIGTTTRLKDFFPIFPNERYVDFLSQAWRVMKKNRHLYLFCDDETRDILKPLAIAQGFTYWKCIAWDKISRGGGYHYANTHEYIMFLEKGKRNLNTKSSLSVLHYKSVRADGHYPTEKPVELLEHLIMESSQPDELVFDPFLGSASCAEAAWLRGRRFVGGDIEDRSIAYAKDRMQQVKARELLPVTCLQLYKLEKLKQMGLIHPRGTGHDVRMKLALLTG